MKKKTLLYLNMIAFVVILVILDQISKFVATANLMGKSKYIVIKGLLSFNYLEGGNKGAAWGIFSGKILMFVIDVYKRQVYWYWCWKLYCGNKTGIRALPYGKHSNQRD